MISKRISYYWLPDFFKTLLLNTFLFTLFSGILYFVNGEMHPDFLPTFYFFALPFLTIIIGLRPVIGLKFFPNTLYITKNEKINIDRQNNINLTDIKSVKVKQLGFATSHIFIYEITLDTIPESLKKYLKDEKTIICTERYYLKNIFGTKTIFLNELLKLGLKEKKIEWRETTIEDVIGFKYKSNK